MATHSLAVVLIINGVSTYDNLTPVNSKLLYDSNVNICFNLTKEIFKSYLYVHCDVIIQDKNILKNLVLKIFIIHLIY